MSAPLPPFSVLSDCALTKPDSVTIVRAPALWPAKRIWPDHVDSYSQAKHLDVTTQAVAGLDDIGLMLAELIRDPRAAVMRGALIDPGRTRHVRRLLYADRKTGEQPTFRDQPRQWLALDIDGIARPNTLPAADLAGCAALAIGALPPAFHDARSIVQATASHGIKPGCRLHLWFWLDRPTSGDELKRWLAGAPADPAAFGAVTPLYTAAPLFMDGLADPLPHRLTELPGRELVHVPSIAALAPPPERPREPAGSREPIPAGLLDRFVARVQDRVRSAPEGQRHATLRGAAVSLGGIQDLAGFGDGEATRWLLDALAIPASRAKDADTIAWGLANGRARPIAREITAKTRSGADKSANLHPVRHLAGEIGLARCGVRTALPAYYPVPAEPRETALARQTSVIQATITESVRLAAARGEIWRRREAEIVAMGLDGLALTPGRKGGITRRLHKAVAAERGYGPRLPLPLRVLLTGAQGTGKTAAAVVAVAAITEPVNIWLTELTSEKAAEAAADYAKATRDRPGALPGMLVRGRGQMDPARPGKTMCDRADVARQVAEARLSVRKTLCPACPFRDGCGYRKQAARIEAMPPAMYFLPSAYLYLPSPAPTPDILILDEQVTLALIRPRSRLPRLTRT